MAGFKGMKWRKEAMYIGMASRMYTAGMTPEDISEKLGQPVEVVNYWLGLVLNTDKIKEEIAQG